LRVVHMLVDRPAIGAAAGRTLEFPLEFGARLNEPTIPQGDEEHRIYLAIDKILASRDEAERTDAAAQNRNRFIFWNLRTARECGNQIHAHGEQEHTSPEHGRGFSNNVYHEGPHQWLRGLSWRDQTGGTSPW